MKIFYDSEFTGLHKDTTLISIALVDEEGRSLYAEFNDYDPKQVDEWIEENVLENTINLRRSNNIKIKHDMQTLYPTCKFLFGSKKTLRQPVLDWISKYDEIELVSDVGHYDVVLLIDFLYGSALQSPIYTYIDANTLIADEYNISINEAFDYSREKLSTYNECEDEAIQINKHNALYDTLVLKSIYESLKKPKKRKRKTTKKES